MQTSLLPPQTEKAFMAQIVEAAKHLGWLSYHTFDSRRSASGFPDLVLVRGPRLIFAEIKTDTGKLTESQRIWMAKLDQAAAEVYVWRPAGWDEIVKKLA